MWAPKVPPGPLLLNEESRFVPQLTPSTHSQLGELVGVVGGRGRRMVNVHLGLEPMTMDQEDKGPNHLPTRPHTCTDILSNIPVQMLRTNYLPLQELSQGIDQHLGVHITITNVLWQDTGMDSVGRVISSHTAHS